MNNATIPEPDFVASCTRSQQAPDCHPETLTTGGGSPWPVAIPHELVGECGAYLWAASTIRVDQ